MTAFVPFVQKCLDSKGGSIHVCFHYVTGEKGGPANAPSCIVAYSKADTESVAVAASAGKFNGKLVILKQSSEIGE